MRKVSLIGAAVVLAVAIGLALTARPDFLDLVGLGGSNAALRRIALSFLEDIQFKDFVKAARYHAPEIQKSVDIPYLIERLFALKPEFLDIMGYEVVFAKIDSSGLRARVKTLVKVKNLADGSLNERELMLYFERDTPKSPWHMKLESSLRGVDADPDKKH
ncbi:MAG: hypothetical protein ABIJ09_09280 [Pseudomonadota bacterium]